MLVCSIHVMQCLVEGISQLAAGTHSREYHWLCQLNNFALEGKIFSTFQELIICSQIINSNRNSLSIGPHDLSSLSIKYYGPHRNLTHDNCLDVGNLQSSLRQRAICGLLAIDESDTMLSVYVCSMPLNWPLTSE